MTRKFDRSIAALERAIKDAKARLGNPAPGPKLRRAVEAVGAALAAWQERPATPLPRTAALSRPMLRTYRAWLPRVGRGLRAPRGWSGA